MTFLQQLPRKGSCLIFKLWKRLIQMVFVAYGLTTKLNVLFLGFRYMYVFIVFLCVLVIAIFHGTRTYSRPAYFRMLF